MFVWGIRPLPISLLTFSKYWEFRNVIVFVGLWFERIHIHSKKSSSPAVEIWCCKLDKAPYKCRTFSSNSSEGMNVMCVDKLFLEDHLHWHNDLSHDDQKISCSQTKNKNKAKLWGFFYWNTLRSNHIKQTNKQIRSISRVLKKKKKKDPKENKTSYQWSHHWVCVSCLCFRWWSQPGPLSPAPEWW